MIRSLLLGVLLAAGGCASLPPAESSVRVLVFNIHAGKDAAGAPNLEAVAALVGSTRADLVLLQEVDRGTRRSGGVDQVQRLEELTGYDAAFGRSLDYDGGQYGIAALARLTFASGTTSPLLIQPPQPRAGGSYEPRVALSVTAMTAIGLLGAVNTHLDASRGETYRLQESLAVTRIARDMGFGGLPVIAAGDFNAEPGSETYRQILEAGLRDAWTECGTGPGLTFPASQPVKRIDYVFMNATVRCTAAEVIATRISDHRPLLVTVTRP